MPNMKPGQLGRIHSSCTEPKLINRIVQVTVPDLPGSLETGALMWKLDKPLVFHCSHCDKEHSVQEFHDIFLRPIQGDNQDADETLSWLPVPMPTPAVVVPTAIPA